LGLSPGARSQWISYQNHVDHEQGAGRSLAESKPLINKMPEQAARIAGVLQIIVDPSATEIVSDIMCKGIALADWHLGEAVRLSRNLEVNVGLENAQTLLDWLHDTGRDVIGTGEVLQFGPGQLRQKAKVDQAFKELVGHFWLRPHPQQRRRWLVTPRRLAP
jgi:hypothetical protein